MVERFIHDNIKTMDVSDEEKWDLEQKRRKKLRNEITHKLRFHILEKSNYECFYCGRGRKTHKDIVLEVDHLKPLDKGGTNDEDNLVTACWECNEGKKNILLAEFDLSVGSKYKLHIDEIIKVAESSDHEKFKIFLANPSHIDDRQLLYDLWDKIDRNCPKNCGECSNTGNFLYIGCMQRLYTQVKKIDGKDLIPLEYSPPMKPRVANMPMRTSELNKLQCDTCYVSTRCREYRVGQSCAFDLTLDIVDPKDSDGVMNALIAIQEERVYRGQFFEKVDGGALDKNVSQEIGLLARLVREKGAINMPSKSLIIKATQTGEGGGDFVGDLFKEIFKSQGKGEEVESVDAEIIDDDEDK